MDVEPLSFEDTRTILQTLERINRWLGGIHATLTPLRDFAKRWKPGERIRMVDWGTGGADIPRAIVRWARNQKVRVEIVGVDNNEMTLKVAQQLCEDYPEIRFVKADVTEEIPGAFDYALSSLSLHHMTNDTIIQLLKKSDRLARRGIVMNDLRRSRWAWLWIWGLTKGLGAHPVVHDDGPMSVARGFTVSEMESFGRAAGLPYLKVTRSFPYRLVLAGEKA